VVKKVRTGPSSSLTPDMGPIVTWLKHSFHSWLQRYARALSLPSHLTWAQSSRGSNIFISFVFTKVRTGPSSSLTSYEPSRHVAQTISFHSWLKRYARALSPPSHLTWAQLSRGSNIYFIHGYKGTHGPSSPLT